MRRWPGLVLLGSIVAMVLLGAIWTPYDPAAIDVAARLQRASAAHLLGTDQLGRDLLSRLLAGGGPSFEVACLAVLIGSAGGIPLGLFAAAAPRWADEIVARSGDVLFAFPALVLALTIMAVFGPGAIQAGLAVGLVFVPVFLRVTRAAARGVWTRDFILAARLAGAGQVRISLVHVLPNIAPVLLVQVTVQLAMGVLAEAGLSFLGLGAQPPLASWGRMIADAQTLVAEAPRLVILPGLLIVASVLAVTLAGDELRRHVLPEQKL